MRLIALVGRSPPRRHTKPINGDSRRNARECERPTSAIRRVVTLAESDITCPPVFFNCVESVKDFGAQDNFASTTSYPSPLHILISVAGATNGPLLFCLLHAPHRTCTHGSMPQAPVPNVRSVMPVSCHVVSVSRQCHVSVAGATSRPLIFCPLPTPHTGLAPRLHTPGIRHQRHSVIPVSCHVLSVSRQHHVNAMPHALQALSNSGPVSLCNSASLEASLCFWLFLRPSSAFSLFLCLRITWTILRLFSCINSGPPTLPVPHLSLFWLWAQVSLHLYIVRDLFTSGFGHRSASAYCRFPTKCSVTRHAGRLN
jgi:hypothetical protein